MIFIVVKVFHDIFMILSFYFLLVLTQQHKDVRCTDGLLSADLKCKINSICLPEKKSTSAKHGSTYHQHDSDEFKQV